MKYKVIIYGEQYNGQPEVEDAEDIEEAIDIRDEAEQKFYAAIIIPESKIEILKSKL